MFEIFIHLHLFKNLKLYQMFNSKLNIYFLWIYNYFVFYKLCRNILFIKYLLAKSCVRCWSSRLTRTWQFFFFSFADLNYSQFYLCQNKIWSIQSLIQSSIDVTNHNYYLSTQFSVPVDNIKFNFINNILYKRRNIATRPSKYSVSTNTIMFTI